MAEGPFDKRYRDAAIRIMVNGQRQLWHTRTVGELCLSPEKNGPSTSYRKRGGRWFLVVRGDLKQHGKDAGFDQFLDQLHQQLEPLLTKILAKAEIEEASLVS